MKTSILVATLLFLCFGCTSQQTEELTQQQKDQIKTEVKAVADSIMARFQRLDSGWFQYYSDSPDWVLFNIDCSRWDYQITKKFALDFSNSCPPL
jgi:hypothetical protein